MNEHFHRRDVDTTYWKMMPIVVALISAAIAGGTAAVTFYAVANEKFIVNNDTHAIIGKRLDSQDERLRELGKAVAELKVIRQDISEINDTLKDYVLRRSTK